MTDTPGGERRTFGCPDDLWDWLGDYADENDTTRDAVLRGLIGDFRNDVAEWEDNAD